MLCKMVLQTMEFSRQIPLFRISTNIRNSCVFVELMRIIKMVAIQAVSNIARSMLLDGSAYWKNYIESDLCPMTIIYAAYIHFHTPRNQVCPADVFFGSTASCPCPKDLHVWVCPEFVLETKPQEGQNLPRWEPGSCKGMHIGLCHVHASYVPLISSLTTAAISPRF